MVRDVEMKMKNEAKEPFIYPRLQIVKAKEEAWLIYPMAQDLFRRREQPPSAPKEVANPKMGPL